MRHRLFARRIPRDAWLRHGLGASWLSAWFNAVRWSVYWWIVGPWDGVEDRNCGEHRTTYKRAWCFDCGEWCYRGEGCEGCQLVSAEDEREKAR